jgi:Leucine-rich repeat (LRR) protein
LDISNLQLKSITPIISSLDHLENLDISGNALKELDVEEISKLKNLKSINISSNKLQVRPEFLNQDLVVEDMKNPYLLSLLISIAEFSEEEYFINYKILFSRNNANFVSDTSIILEDCPKNSQLIQERNLSDWLEIIKDYYSGAIVDESNIKEILMIEKINQIINRITSIIEKKPDEIFATNQKKIIARDLLIICSKLYEQKLNPKFLDAVNKIITIEDQNFDQRLWLKITCLYNLCFTKTLEELELDISVIDDYSTKQESFDISRIDKKDQTLEIEKFQSENFVFSYIKNKLLFDYIFDLVKKNSEQISILEVINNDYELFINYLGVFNERFSSQLELIFPAILYPKDIDMKIHKYPSKVDVKELTEICKAKIDCANFMPLCYLMAKQVVEKISEPEDSCDIFEISNLQFIKQLKNQIDNIAEIKIQEIRGKTKTDSNLFKKIDKEIIEQGKHELTNLITMQFIKISQNQKPSANISDEDTENILKNFDRFYKQILFEEKKLELTMDTSSRKNPDSSNRTYSSSPGSSCSKCLSVILPFQIPKKTKEMRCKSVNYQPSI